MKVKGRGQGLSRVRVDTNDRQAVAMGKAIILIFQTEMVTFLAGVQVAQDGVLINVVCRMSIKCEEKRIN